MNKQKMLDRIRKKLADKKGGNQRDPNEWYPPKIDKEGDTKKFKLVVLPPLEEGDVCATGNASRGMDEIFYVPVGYHWYKKRPHPCPRIFDGEDCPMCEFGFELFSETDDKEQRSYIGKTYLPNTRYAVNVWFPPYESTPEELRGQVKWVQLPKTIAEIMEKTIAKDDDGGDPDDPEAFGVFYLTGLEEFDDGTPNPGGYTFQLVAVKESGFNNYKTSKFLPNSLGPLVKDGQGGTNAVKIQKILDARHDLHAKFDERNPAKLKEIVNEILAEDDGDATSEFDGDEEQDTKSTANTNTKVDTKADTSDNLVEDTTEDTEELLDEPEEETPAPKAKAKKAAKPKATKATEQTETEEEDDEELAGLLAEIHSDE